MIGQTLINLGKVSMLTKIVDSGYNNSTIGALTLTGIGSKPIDYENDWISNIFVANVWEL